MPSQCVGQSQGHWWAVVAHYLELLSGTLALFRLLTLSTIVSSWHRLLASFHRDIVYWHRFIVTSSTGIVSSWHRVLASFHRDIVYWHRFIVTSCTGIVSSWHRVLASFHRDIVYWHCFIVTSCTGIVSSTVGTVRMLVQNKHATNMRIIFLCSLSMVVKQIMITCNRLNRRKSSPSTHAKHCNRQCMIPKTHTKTQKHH